MMAVTRREIIEYLRNTFQTNNVVVLDEFEKDTARHICHGYTEISLLKMQKTNVALPDGNMVVINYFYCPRCGKLLLEKDSLTVTYPQSSIAGNRANMVSAMMELRSNPEYMYPAYNQPNPFIGEYSMGNIPPLFEETEEEMRRRMEFFPHEFF